MTAYEKGAANNLVKFSMQNDLAFEDAGVNINDEAPPSPNVLWSSNKIANIINQLLQYYKQQPQYQYQPPPPPPPQEPQPPPKPEPEPLDYNKSQYRYNKAHLNLTGPYGGSIDVTMPRFGGFHRRGHRDSRFHRIFHPSFLASLVIPSRQHYCDKCNYYMNHKYSSRWKNDIRPGSSCAPKCGCDKTGY